MKPEYTFVLDPLGAYDIYKGNKIQLSFGIYDSLEEVVIAFTKYLNKEVIL